MSTRVDARQRNRVAKAISLTPEIKQNTLVTFLAVALLLSCSPKVLEGLETSLSPEILQRFKEIDPNFNAKACLQELSDLGVSSVTDLALKHAWRFIEVCKENESLLSRKEAFEGLLEEERREGDRLLAKLTANERRMEDHLQRILALEKKLQSAKDDLRYKENGSDEGSAGLGANDGSVSEWKRIAEECQSRLKEIEVRNKEEVLSLERKVSDLRKQLENWEASYQQSRDSRTVNALEVEVARVKKELAESKDQADHWREMFKQHESRVEELVMELSSVKLQLQRQQPNKTLDIATILKENSNLRAALKTLEQMKMEVENEKVAVQDQLLEYQRKCGVFDKPRPPVAPYKIAANRIGAGRVRTIADGVVRATVAPSPRACPFCETEFATAQLETDENDFMDHVNSCRGLSMSEITPITQQKS